ncbi:rab-GTPase-TBC domain-domain-containing protein [Naematelia encephala]|uniref:GTPase-activating protein GYP5 n=1 Tax=Naematelia encephala TaxID=71784 RepID=A0A1Y2BHD8_9TREE|nr:rab-GTPase-TBC domain-domain-containing protein [Naematelia encephala]
MSSSSSPQLEEELSEVDIDTPIPATSPPSSSVRAKAAMFEDTSTPKPTRTPDRVKLSPSTSFRSISASSSKGRLDLSRSSESPPSAGPSILHDSPLQQKKPLLSSPSQEDLSTPRVAQSGVIENFSDISLSVAPDREQEGPTVLRSHSLSLLPPPPGDLSAALPEPVVPPLSTEKPSAKSIFSSALGFGFPSSSSTSSESSNTLEPGSATTPTSGGWRSTVTNLLSRSTSSTSPTPNRLPSPSTHSTAASLPHTYHPPPGPSNTDPSADFLSRRFDSTTASRDRRISREAGGGEKLREGFERVRGEMEGAAREMRRERAEHKPTPHDVQDDSPETLRRANVESVDWVFWGAVVQDYEEVARTRPKELSKAIQQGIPAVIRGAIWQLMSSSKSAALEEEYKALLKMTSPHEKAIIKDLSRTFPSHKFFQEGGGLGQESLFMVVKAYSLYDQEVGYTQGLAFIVAALLLNMPDEEAFCVLVRLMDSYNLRSHFLADMPGLQLRLFQFDRLVEEILPLLHQHLTRKGVKSSMYASQWFMTLFSYRFPLSLVYRVLDIVFAEGIEAIFRFSLALLQKSEAKLVNLEFEQILSYLQSDLFEVYRSHEPVESESDLGEGEWKANEFVRDAYEIRITPFTLDSYESEYDEQQRSQNRHALELDSLRNVNRNLSNQVKQLEASLVTMNNEHVMMVRQLVMAKIEKEEAENELVRYKMLYAEQVHQQQNALSAHSRMSAGSLPPERSASSGSR